MSLIDSAKGPLTKKAGPLPIIAWAGIAIAALLVYKLMRGGGGGASAGVTDAFDGSGAANPDSSGGASGGGSGAGTGGTTDDPAPTPIPGGSGAYPMPVPPIPIPIGARPPLPPIVRPMPVIVKPDAHRKPAAKAPIHVAAKRVPVKHYAPGKPKIVARIKPKVRRNTARKAIRIARPTVPTPPQPIYSGYKAV